jgi:hypothetical protein
MSKIGNYVLDLESRGELIYDEYRLDYVTPEVFALRTDLEYLEWQIQSLERDIKIKKLELIKAERLQ